jgi:hypothetical protein
MPIYLRNTPGTKRGGDLAGPYEESRLKTLRTYAQGLSERTGGTIEAYWLCGRRRPMLLFIYRDGKQAYPRTKQEERQLEGVTSCLSRPGANAKSQERTPRKINPNIFSSARKLPGRFACPARIVTSEPLQDFSMPRPVQPLKAEQTLSQILPPIGPAYGPGQGQEGFWGGSGFSGPKVSESD